jgi:hypothetical protein
MTSGNGDRIPKKAPEASLPACLKMRVTIAPKWDYQWRETARAKCKAATISIMEIKPQMHPDRHE